MGKQRLKGFGNVDIFWHMRKEVTGGWKLYDLYFSSNIIRVTISRRSWAGHVVCMRE